MPKQVDHAERRRQIAASVASIVTEGGIGDVTFRSVATRAGVSVSLVQHYFGNKEQLLVDALDIRSGTMGERISRRLEALGSAARPLDRVRTVAEAFIPSDDASRDAMRVYLGFAGAAIADDRLRSAAAFRNGEILLEFLAGEFASAASAGELASNAAPRSQALALVSLVLGLSLGVLLDQTSSDEAAETLDAYLALSNRRT